MVIEQAMRWNMSPFAVAQCTSAPKGKLMFEGKLVAAAVENSGAIVGFIDYHFSGEGQNRKVTVTATRRGETEAKSVDVLLKDAATTNDIWKKQPDQQLCYHGARVWARRWTPGVMLGVYSPEEMEDVSSSSRVIDVTPDTAREQPAPATPPALSEKVRQFIDGAKNQLSSCEDPEEWLALDAKTKDFRAKLERNHNTAWVDFEASFAEARERLFPAAEREPGEEG